MAAPRLSAGPTPVATASGDAPPAAPHGWPRLLALGAALVGLAIAVYLSIVHVTTAVPLYCSATGVVNCEQVVTSPASVVFGVPVAFYGVAWFAIMALLLAWRGGFAAGAGRLAWSGVGTLTVLYLVYTELFVIGAICLWCSAVHVLVLAIFTAQALFPSMRPAEAS